jgi:hypothetical protein
MKAAQRARGERVTPGYSSTYHEDGGSWEKFLGDRNSRKVRNPPLSDFSGALTLRTLVCPMVDMSLHRQEGAVSLRADDVIFERDVTFGVEVILAEKVLVLPPLTDRVHSVTYIKDQLSPVIMIEVFDLASNVLPLPRFERAVPLTEGENVFFNYPGRI